MIQPWANNLLSNQRPQLSRISRLSRNFKSWTSKVMAAEVVARAAKEEVARVIEDYKKFANFEDEVNKTAYDAY